MIRRRMTLKRVDPWSVLKFGFVANLSLLAILLLGSAVVWFFVQRLELIGKVCEIATEMGFVECGVNGGNLFKMLFLLGLLGVVIQTGLVVFLAFLYNLIADLVGGLTFTFVDDTPGAAARGDVPATRGRVAGTFTDTTASPAARPSSSSSSSSSSEAAARSGSGSSSGRPPVPPIGSSPSGDRPSTPAGAGSGSTGSGSTGNAPARDAGAPRPSWSPASEQTRQTPTTPAPGGGSSSGTTPGGGTSPARPQEGAGPGERMWGDRPSAPERRDDRDDTWRPGT